MVKPYKFGKYESVLEKLHRELGESYKADFKGDSAQFNIPNHFPEESKAMISAGSAPVGGRRNTKEREGDKEQFSDENAQLSMKSSSTIQAAAYWPNKQYLVVSFKSGATYSYEGVNVGVVKAWQQASSAGSFFYYNIRTSYSYRKM